MGIDIIQVPFQNYGIPITLIMARPFKIFSFIYFKSYSLYTSEVYLMDQLMPFYDHNLCILKPI